MTQDPSKRAAVEGEGEDIVTALPRNVVDRILELLPVCDAAKTSILSRKWRDIWASFPYLVLNNFFCKKLTAKSESVFRETIDLILLQHTGDIVRFDLDVSRVNLSSYTDIDRWMLYVTRNGVKRLTLNMSDNISAYKLPSYIFNCRTLTQLRLFNCIFKPPNSFFGFNNLITLYLEGVAFEPATEFCVINVPVLLNMTLRYCDGTQYLNIVVSSGLKYLLVLESHYNLDLNRFMNCKSLTYLYLVVNNPIHSDKMSTYEKLIFSLSALETLTLGSFVLELLSTGVVTKGLPSTLNCLWHLQLGIDLGKICQTSYALEIIQSLPNLSKLQIWVYAACDKDEMVMKYLDKPACLDRPLDKLEDVVMHSFRGSKSELFFIKLLFARAPSLVRMNIKQWKTSGPREERNISKELMRFPRASPKAELFYSTNAD